MISFGKKNKVLINGKAMVLEVFVLLAGIVRVSFIVVIVVTIRWLFV